MESAGKKQKLNEEKERKGKKIKKIKRNKGERERRRKKGKGKISDQKEAQTLSCSRRHNDKQLAVV